jgi:hypothetical protein
MQKDHPRLSADYADWIADRNVCACDRLHGVQRRGAAARCEKTGGVNASLTVSCVARISHRPFLTLTGRFAAGAGRVAD